MKYYVDISTEQFEGLRDHETDELVIPRSLAEELTGRGAYPFFETGDELKLYHPSDDPEALRMEILSFPGGEEESGDLRIRLKLNEWMMALPKEEFSEDSELLFW